MNDVGGAWPWGPPDSLPAGPPMAPPTSGLPTSPPLGMPVGVGSPAAAPPELSFAASPGPSRRSRWAVGGLVVGVLALGAAGVFAVGQLRSNSSGAASPEAVGTEFMAALEQEDVLGLMDLLLPGEREVFRQPMIDVVSELARLEVLSASATLADLAGLDIEMANESTAVESTNVADISNITMSATLSASIDGDQLPIGDFISDLGGDDFAPSDLDQPTTTEEFSLPMTVVEDDGRWYLSLFHTAAEAARGELGGPIPEVGLTPRGGADPAGALGALLDGVEQLDLGKVIAAINPNEAAALQRYAPLFLDDVDALASDVPLDWQVTRSEYEVVGSGSRRFVTITALRIDGILDGVGFGVELVGGCLVVETDDERIDTCDLGGVDANANTTLDDFFGGSLGINELTSAFEAAFADYEQPGITVQEVDGEWFVSPIGSGFDQFLALLSALDRDEIDQLIEASTTFATDLQVEFDNFPFPDEFQVDDSTSDFPLDDAEFDSDSDSDFEAEQEAAAICYDLDAVEDVTACLLEGIESGALPEYYVGVELQFPECGLAESSLGRTPLFSMSDEDYTAMMVTSSACFEALIASGAVDRTAVPSEYLKPECGEGRNPWSFDVDDDEFFDRWIECVYS